MFISVEYSICAAPLQIICNYKNIICKFTYSMPVYSTTWTNTKKSALSESILPELLKSAKRCYVEETATGFMQF
jgi:hypothetical protein